MINRTFNLPTHLKNAFDQKREHTQTNAHTHTYTHLYFKLNVHIVCMHRTDTKFHIYKSLMKKTLESFIFYFGFLLSLFSDLLYCLAPMSQHDCIYRHCLTQYTFA